MWLTLITSVLKPYWKYIMTALTTLLVILKFFSGAKKIQRLEDIDANQAGEINQDEKEVEASNEVSSDTIQKLSDNADGKLSYVVLPPADTAASKNIINPNAVHVIKDDKNNSDKKLR